MKLRRVIFTNSSTVRVLSMTRFVVDKLAPLVLARYLLLNLRGSGRQYLR